MNFETDGDTLKIILKDNGVGMDINKVKFGNGISNMKKRAEAIGWKLKIDSYEGNGTEIIFSGKFKSRKLLGLMK